MRLTLPLLLLAAALLLYPAPVLLAPPAKPILKALGFKVLNLLPNSPQFFPSFPIGWGILS